MITLHLGVTDVPYGHAPGSLRKRPKKVSSQTTGDVAEILEAKYGVMNVFVATNRQFIQNAVIESLQGALENVLAGGPVGASALGEATSAIETRFKEFLSNGEMERMGLPGVPTEAALRGVSHRFKRPYARRPPRPSFIDTGLYQSSFKVTAD